MHCDRLATVKEELQNAPASDALNSLTPDSREHLKTCAECQAELQRVEELGLALRELNQSDDSEIPSFAAMHDPLREQSRTVRTQRASAPGFSESLSRLLNPRFGFSLAALIIALGFYSYMSTPEQVTNLDLTDDLEEIIGYEVTFAGVEKDLAENPESICDLLSTLELFEANIDSVSCENTCRLSIIDLQSAEDAGLVVEAFSRLGAGYQSAEVVPVTTASAAG
jgi:hypothetical protein